MKKFKKEGKKLMEIDDLELYILMNYLKNELDNLKSEIDDEEVRDFILNHLKEVVNYHIERLKMNL